MCQRVAAPGTDQLTQDELMKEVWLPVRGYEGLYEVSDLGRVRSLDRKVKQKSRWGGETLFLYKGKVLKPTNEKDRYLMVALRFRQKVRVHVLVAEAFLDPCPGPRGKTRGCWEVDHINNNPHDNRAENLRWLPKKVNGFDRTNRIRNGKGQFV